VLIPKTTTIVPLYFGAQSKALKNVITGWKCFEGQRVAGFYPRIPGETVKGPTGITSSLMLAGLVKVY
jgi:hypothetical protein